MRDAGELIGNDQGMTDSEIEGEPVFAGQLAYVARQADQLRESGATVLMRQVPMAPDVIGALSQLLPGGAVVVHVDATKGPMNQSFMLAQAFEFIFNEPEANWEIAESTADDGEISRSRSLTFRGVV